MAMLAGHHVLPLIGRAALTSPYDRRVKASCRMVPVLVVLFAAGCAGVPEPAAVPAGDVDPAGTDQVVTYTRNRSGRMFAMYLDSASGAGGGALGGNGCQAVAYPWSISVGPEDADPSTYEQLIKSGNATEGTATVWIDVSPTGDVIVGSGRPDWATSAAAADCG